MKILLLFFSFVILFANQKVSILLDWKYQFEFAGYIAAKEKGFYKNLGLDVKLVEYNNNNIVQDILNNKYNFGIYDNHLIDDKIKGKNVKLVSSFFKRSALVLIVSPKIKTLKNLENKTIMISEKDKSTFKDFLKNNGVNIKKINFIPTNYSIEPFINKKIDGFSAFLTDEPYLLKKRGVKYNIINPSDYNFLMYQGELFSNNNFANNNPILVDKIKKATIKGWEYALNHKKELVNIIYNKYSKKKDKLSLLDEANKLETIIQRKIYPIGYIDKPLLKAQFLYTAKKLQKNNIDIDEKLDEYIFEFKNPLNLDKKYLPIIKLYNFYLLHKFSIIISIIFLLILLILLYFYKKLQNKTKKIETLFDKVPVAYVIADYKKRTIIKANNYAYDLFQYPKSNILNISSEIFHIDKAHYIIFQNMTNEYIKTYHTLEGFNTIWQFKKYKDKTNMWLNVKAVMYSDTEILWIATDIDKIVKTQKELNLQIKATQKAMKVKEEFLANMSHEIRTPLNAMLGFINIIYEKETNNDNKKYLDIIKTSGKSLLTIINDILDFSKIESGKLQIENIEFNPKDEFEILVSLFYSKAKEKNINLQVKCTGLVYNIISDPTRIKQVISNLISNAIKFTPENKNIYCNIIYDENKENLYVEVIDEGIGIKKDKLEHIFEAFAQADSSTTRKYGGTGLGLSISKNLVKLLGGDLKIESEEGKGTKFYFSIPAKKTNFIANKTEKEEPSKINIKFNAKVLIVEDNKANQMFFKVILNSIGIKDITIANDGIEGVQKANDEFDIIFMDENMPNMNGLEATKQIKAKGIKTPIISVTANALSGDKEKFLKVMDDYLSKPVEKEKLIEILNKYLKGIK